MTPDSLGLRKPAAGGLSLDTRSLDALRARAGSDPRGAVREAAKQFEALFMQELMKSMRAATMAVGALDNEGSKMGTEMLDGQWASQLSGLPGGLSEAIARHLERQIGGLGAQGEAAQSGARPSPAAPAGAESAPAAPGPSAAPAALPRAGAAFVDRHSAAAARAEAETGIPAAFMLAQAAHETGWGRREIRHADGSPAHNLFGIKAGPGWQGPVAEITTTEFVGGVAQKVTAKFRAYASPAESFADYARMMRTSPRYRGLVERAESAQGLSAQGFAQGLQAAGYATDPAYADKLSRVINTTLRLQRAQA